MPNPSSVNYLTRSNTICFDVKEAYPGPKVPTSEWVDFLLDHVCDPTEIVETSVHSITGHLLVKLKTDEKFKEILEKGEKGISWTKYNSVVFGWSITDFLTNVRIINVTIHIDHEKIRQKMAEFGQLIHFSVGYHKKMPGVRDGSINIKMKVKEGVTIPSFIDIVSMGECLQIFTDSGPRVCFKCTKVGHIAAFCRSKSKEVNYSTQTSWAKIVTNETITEETEEIEDISDPPPSVETEGRGQSAPPLVSEEVLDPPPSQEVEEVEQGTQESPGGRETLPPTPSQVKRDNQGNAVSQSSSQLSEIPCAQHRELDSSMESLPVSDVSGIEERPSLNPPRSNSPLRIVRKPKKPRNKNV
jgi:hypothetical protein